MSIVVKAVALDKTYQAGEVALRAVRGANFTIEGGAFVAFVGPSGSGKSTLLNMIGCLDHPTSGRLGVLDTDVATLDRRAAAEFRGANLGFVFQDFNLIPVLSAYENIEYPLLMVQDWPADKRRARVNELLEAVGMRDQADQRPDQLSGGQKQRVAVARALVANSKLVLADEPTANLDHDTAYRLIKEAAAAADSDWVRFVRDHELRSPIVVAHVRRATMGERSYRNTQPFTRELAGRMHLLAHNGWISGIFEAPALRPRRFMPVGETPALDARLDIVAEFAGALRRFGPANFLYSDGDALFAHGHRRLQAATKRAEPPGDESPSKSVPGFPRTKRRRSSWGRSSKRARK